MSIKNHPNIQAVAVTVDLFESIKKNLRGDAKKIEEEVLNEMSDFVVDCITAISVKIDRIVEKEK